MSTPQDWANANQREGEPKASAITWTSEGHKPLDEARRSDLDELEAFEARLHEADLALEEASQALDKARRERDRAYNKRQDARKAVNQARASLLRRLPAPPPEPIEPASNVDRRVEFGISSSSEESHHPAEGQVEP